MGASWKPSARTSGRFQSLVVVDETGSTNADLVRRANEGAPPGDVLIARHQTAGRGRQGRSWFDRPDSSLLMSWSIDIDPVSAPLVPLVVGTAVSTAIDRTVGAPVTGLKWPNDVLAPGHDERKLTGILAEAVATSRAAGSASTIRVVVGMGTNLDLGLDRDDLPPDVLARAIDLRTLLAEAAGTVLIDRPSLVDAILDACDDSLDELERSPRAAIETYRSKCLTIGRSLRFETPAGDVEGRAVDVGLDGVLVIEETDGTVRRLTAGDAHHTR